MIKKLIAIILIIVILSGVALACYAVFSPKTLEISVVDVPYKQSVSRGQYYELTSEGTFEFTATTKTKLFDVSAEYECVLGGSKEKMYFLEVKEGQESVRALSMSDLASTFLSVKVKGSTLTVRTSASRPLSGDVFGYDGKMLKYVTNFESNKTYTVIDNGRTSQVYGYYMNDKNTGNQYRVNFTLTVNDVSNELSETVNLWIVPGASSVTLSEHKLTF